MTAAHRRRWIYLGLVVFTALLLVAIRVTITRNVEDRLAVNYEIHPREFLHQASSLRPGMSRNEITRRVPMYNGLKEDLISRTYYLLPTRDARARGVTGPRYYIRVDLATDGVATSINKGSENPRRSR